MAIITGGQITKYYESYCEIDVSFNRQVISFTVLNPHDVFLRVLGLQIPCIIYSSSMAGAKVLANLDKAHFEKIRKSKNKISLRFSFKRDDNAIPRTFFIASKVTGFRPFSKDNPKTNFISLSYTQKPPNDLIEILGILLDINVNSKKRKEQRITIDDSSVRKLGLKNKSAFLRTQNRPQNAILRDLSFSGAKVFAAGSVDSFNQKVALLQLSFSDLDKPIMIPCKVVRTEEVGDRKDITAVALRFEEPSIPLEYKTKLNQFFTVKK
jgi:hypothetical protein